MTAKAAAGEAVIPHAASISGVDLSLTSTGIVTAYGSTLVATSPADGTDDRRMAQIAGAVWMKCARYGALVVIEGLSMGGPRADVRLAGLHYVVRCRLLTVSAIPFAVVPPSTLKKFATGRGNATKADMRMALYQRAGIDEPNDNLVDAYWLRYAGLARYDALPFPLPKAQLTALDKVEWPA